MNLLHRAVLSTAIVAPACLFAQASDLGPIVLRIPSSVRALAMGNVAVAGRDDDVLFYNPAQLVAARGTSVSAEQFSSTARTGAMSTVIRFNTGGVAVGATMAEFDSPLAAYPIARADLVSGGPVLGSAGSLVVGMAQVFKSVRYGGSAKWVNERVGQTRNSRAVFDLGLARDFFGYAFGLAVQNIGPSFDLTPSPGSAGTQIAFESRMPLRTTFGAMRGWNTNTFDFTATAAVSTLRDGFLVPAGGAEMFYSWLSGYTVVFRAGARRPEKGEGPLTAGAGITIDRLSFDYALETLSDSRVAHRIGLRIR